MKMQDVTWHQKRNLLNSLVKNFAELTFSLSEKDLQENSTSVAQNGNPCNAVPHFHFYERKGLILDCSVANN